jgi:ribosomal protein S18 acetylase RimI-like enzyme
MGGCVSALAAVHATSGYPTNWPSDPERWLNPSGMIAAWIACARDEVVGHVLVREASDGKAEMGRLFVHPDARVRGVASSLVRRVMKWAMAERLSLVLEVNADLHPAIALYERLGWHRIESVLADWTSPAGDPVSIHRYELPRGAAEQASEGGVTLHRYRKIDE